MINLASGWLATTEQGPGCLFVRLQQPKNGGDHSFALAEEIWDLLDQQFTYRVVLEMDDVATFPSHLIGQLVLLRKRLASHSGMLRLCGVNESCRAVLRTHRLEGVLATYDCRDDALMGRYRPAQPR